MTHELATALQHITECERCSDVGRRGLCDEAERLLGVAAKRAGELIAPPPREVAKA